MKGRLTRPRAAPSGNKDPEFEDKADKDKGMLKKKGRRQNVP